MAKNKHISLIAAVADNNIIGNNNALLWHLPNDLRFFKKKTSGHHIVMGRNTYESIGGGRLLPNRTSVVITRDTLFKRDGAIVVHTIEDAIATCPEGEEIFIIGGAQIYEQTIGMADTLYITKIEHNFIGDTYFPNIDQTQWNLVSSLPKEIDEKHKYKYSFLTYKKRD